MIKKLKEMTFKSAFALILLIPVLVNASTEPVDISNPTLERTRSRKLLTRTSTLQLVQKEEAKELDEQGTNDLPEEDFDEIKEKLSAKNNDQSYIQMRKVDFEKALAEEKELKEDLERALVREENISNKYFKLKESLEKQTRSSLLQKQISSEKSKKHLSYA